jgi:L-methionine (R)-S-oxide reductase
MDAHSPSVASEDWEEVTARILALIEGEDDDIAKMATMACELYQAFERFHWVGFYRVVAPQLLKIGPYQGGHGCLTIPFSRGVCGACATAGKTIIVPDVDAFPGHIACSSTTRSELVAPVFSAGRLIGVLDLDSDHPDAFREAERVAVENLLARAFGQ